MIARVSMWPAGGVLEYPDNKLYHLIQSVIDHKFWMVRRPTLLMRAVAFAQASTA